MWTVCPCLSCTLKLNCVKYVSIFEMSTHFLFTAAITKFFLMLKKSVYNIVTLTSKAVIKKSKARGGGSVFVHAKA